MHISNQAPVCFLRLQVPGHAREGGEQEAAGQRGEDAKGGERNLASRAIPGAQVFIS